MTTTDDWIAPGAALNDPALRERLDPDRKHGLFGLLPAQHAVVRALVARYPWQEYGYKAGRWSRQEGELFERFADYQVWRRSDYPIQLLDPASGSPVGELQSRGSAEIPTPRGRLWLAGDPRLIAVCTPAGDGKKILEVAVSSSALDIDLLKAVGDLRPGEMLPEPSTPFHYQETFPYGRSTWLADCPRKPRRRDGFHWGDKPKPSPEEQAAATARSEAQLAVLEAERERNRPTKGFFGWLNRL